VHHGDAQGDIDRRGRTGRTGDDAALDADPGRDAGAAAGTFARHLGDGGLVADLIAGGRLAAGANGVGRGARAHRDLRAIDVVFGRLAGGRRRLGLGRLVGLAAEQVLEAVG